VSDLGFSSAPDIKIINFYFWGKKNRRIIGIVAKHRWQASQSAGLHLSSHPLKMIGF